MKFDVIRLLVADILEFPERHDWTLQGFGMLRAYLSSEIRLHVWSAAHRVEGVSDIHNHPWDFESMVVCGNMENTLYRVAPGHLQHHLQGKILCGAGPAVRGVIGGALVPKRSGRESRAGCSGEAR